MNPFSLSSIRPYWELMRFHRPIGILLLLWPTYWALWLAAEGMPDWDILCIFTIGVIAMRAAGCVINDIADRRVDGHVKRTADRPLVSGAVSIKSACYLLASITAIAFIAVLFTNSLTIYLAIAAVFLAFAYPFMKRFTHLPQVVLGMAFSMSIPMAFAAQTETLHSGLWLLYTANVLWTVAYDTFYAMADREYDKKIGVKSTAILFEDNDRLITASIQALAVVGWLMVGQRFDLNLGYYAGVIGAIGLIAYEQWIIRHRQPDACLRAFLHSQWVGAAIFIGILLHFATI
ncbi:4-hydroxybenzoate octaprenyltransferase [Eionea flava]